MTHQIKRWPLIFLKQEFAGNDEFYQEILVENGAVGTYLPSQEGEAYQYEDPFFNDASIYKDFFQLDGGHPRR